MVLQPFAAQRLLYIVSGAAALQCHIGDRAATLKSIHNRRINAALGPAEARENIQTIYDGVIDVRMSAEHRLEGRIVDSVSIPAQLWEHGMYLPRDAFVPDVCEQFETDCRLLCVCGDGRRSELAAQQLADCGFSVDYIDGGLNAWAEQSLELEIEDDGGLVGSYV